VSQVRLCGSDELEVGSVRRFALGAGAVALARCVGGYHAVVDNCSHEDYPLSEGEVEPELCEIECLRHGSTFSLVDGEPQSLPATRPVRVLSVVIKDGDVYVEEP
jgi:3-phenylpropionate/trans-cinnamate dioxygenase ferredoxin subunit